MTDRQKLTITFKEDAVSAKIQRRALPARELRFAKAPPERN